MRSFSAPRLKVRTIVTVRKKHRVVVSKCVLDVIVVNLFEPLREMQLVAVLVTRSIEPAPFIDSDCIDDERVSFPLGRRIP